MTDSIQLRTEKFVFGGACLARREDGKAVFIPFTLPDELVSVKIIDERKGHARAQLLEVLEPSPDRIEPKCPHYTICGGCHYQHMTYEKQLEVKQTVFTDQLSRLGGIENPPVKPMTASDQQWNYRSRAQLHQAEDGSLGFQAAGSHQIIPIESCPLLSTSINELLPQIEMEFLPELQRLEIREGDNGQMMIVFQSDDPVPPEMELNLNAAAVHLGPEGPIVMADTMHLQHTLCSTVFQVSAPSFFQVNSGSAEKLAALLLDKLTLTADTTVFDVYCGVGLFSSLLANKVKELIGIESSEYACEDFAVNLDANENVYLYQDDAGRALEAVKAKPDILIVDPPRSGLSRSTRDTILKTAPLLIAYISCDPATLARDVKRMTSAGYVLEESTPLDMFPQTYHIESLSILRKKC